MAVELEKGFITNDSGTAIPRVLKPLTPDDPEHPQNWSTVRRIWITLMLSYFNLIGTIMSSVFGSGQKTVAEEMGISVEVSILSTTLFLVVREALCPSLPRAKLINYLYRAMYSASSQLPRCRSGLDESTRC